MACPKCGCKTTCQYNGDWTGLFDGDVDDERLERCAACGTVFDIEDSTEEEDDGETM